MRLAAHAIGCVLFRLWVTVSSVSVLAQGLDASYMRPRVVAVSVEFHDGQDWQPHPKGLGTGFLIDPNGYVLTAKHLAPSQLIGDELQWSKLRVRGRIGDRAAPEIDLELVSVHPSRDAMLLRFNGGADAESRNFFAITNKFTLPILQVSAVGFPALEGREMKVVTGFMRSDLPQGAQHGEVNEKLSGGFSGCPVLLGREVIGLVDSSSTDATRNTFKFIPIRSIKDWLSGHIELNVSSLSTDYGDWRLASPSWGFFHGLQADPRDAKVVYAGLDQGQGVYRSGDGGISWEPKNTGLGNREVKSIAVSAFDERVYAATENGLWRSDDRGSTWLEVVAYRNKSLLSVALSPHDRDLLLVGCQRPGGASAGSGTGTGMLRSEQGVQGEGLKFSLDRGQTFRTFHRPQNVNGIWIDPQDSRVFAIAGAEEGVFYSNDGLENLRITAFPDDRRPLCVACSTEVDTRTLLIGTAHHGLYWSDDEGKTWSHADGIPDTQVSDIKPLQGNSNRVMAATTSGVFESEDGGRKWCSKSKGLAYPWCMKLELLADGSVITGTSGGGAYRLAPGQSVWNISSRGFPPAAGLRIEGRGSWLLAGTAVGLFKSPNNGDSWRFSGVAGKAITAVAFNSGVDSPAPPTQGGLLVDRSNGQPPQSAVIGDQGPSEIIVGTNRGEIFRSRDAGETWNALNVPRDNIFSKIRSITVTGGKHRRIGVLVEYKGFYLSEDDGQTWSAKSAEPLGQAINHVVTVPQNNDTLFALTVDRGVFRSSDAGSNWTTSKGIPSEEIVTAIETDRLNDRIVFAATLNGNLFRSSDSGQRFTRLGQVPALAAIDNSNNRGWTTLTLISDCEDHQTVVMGSFNGAYASRDGGKNWSSLQLGSLNSEYSVNDLHVDDSGTVTMATSKGVFTRKF